MKTWVVPDESLDSAIRREGESKIQNRNEIEGVGGEKRADTEEIGKVWVSDTGGVVVGQLRRERTSQ